MKTIELKVGDVVKIRHLSGGCTICGDPNWGTGNPCWVRMKVTAVYQFVAHMRTTWIHKVTHKSESYTDFYTYSTGRFSLGYKHFELYKVNDTYVRFEGGRLCEDETRSSHM
jgi:hypothetical protein